MTARSRSGGRILTVLSVMILVGCEVFGVALAGGWALAGLLDLGDLAGYVLMALFGLLGLYIMVSFWRRAISVEMGSGG